ncbi:MAG: DUF5123 domain-containing protein [bacterium]
MKKVLHPIFLVFLFLLLSQTILPKSECLALPSAIYFSDLISGPKTGGQNNKGVFVTIVGKNFGTNRGSSYVSVGKGQVDNYPVWTDTKIIFQLGPNATTGDIKVTTGDGTSNDLPFTVRDGKIYFASINSPSDPGDGSFENPWRSPRSFYNVMQPGDTCYIRGGTYTGEYGGTTWSASIKLGAEAPNGQLNREIAWVAYPNEVVRFQATSSVKRNVVWAYEKNYYVFSGFNFSATGACFQFRGLGNRIINNSCEGLKTTFYGILHAHPDCNEAKVYGNKLFGATTGNKLDHALYIGYGADNLDFGWNHIYNNNVGDGPLISTHQDSAAPQGLTFENNLIHDNIIDGRNSSNSLPRAIGFGEQAAGSSAKVYNNIIIGCGGTASWNYCIYVMSGSIQIYNNTIYNAKGSYALGIYTVNWGTGRLYAPSVVEIKNNIFYTSSGCDYISIQDESQIKSLTIDHNCYYGNGAGPIKDTNAINLDPLFTNQVNDDFTLRSNSPCIDKGTPGVSTVVKKDRNGISRPQYVSYDIGACEYIVNPPQNLKRL